MTPNYENPKSGTLVDTSIVTEQGQTIFDFYLIAHNATVATARPVEFKVIHNTSSLSKNDIEESTFHLCYGYYGFGGPIKTPAACKYAEKYARYISEHDYEETISLAQKLHFLWLIYDYLSH